MSSGLTYHRPGLRVSMRRDVSNPNRVVPDPNVWRDRKVGAPVLKTRGSLRYARDQIGECNGRVNSAGDRLRLSSGAQRLYVDLCNIALKRGPRGLIDLTYRQLLAERGVPNVQAVTDGGDPAVDEFDFPILVPDPAWGEGIRTLQRLLRELQAAGFAELGYRVNRLCGGHRLCVNITGPDWFLAKIREIERMARSKGGRVSRPQRRRRPDTGGDDGGSYSNPVRFARGPIDCARCGGTGWVDLADGTVDRCTHQDALTRAGP